MTLSCWFQTCRLFGAEIGKTVLSRVLKIQGAFHYNVLAQHLDGRFQTDERLKSLAFALFPGGSGAGDATGRAAEELGNTLKQQITLLSISDGFLVIALSTVVCMLLISLLSYTPPLVSPAAKEHA